MATLIEGQQYGLSSQTPHSTNKTLIFVKLTDSALRAIDKYLSQKSSNSNSLKPTIQLNSTQGVISFPIKNNDREEKQRFSFTLSNMETEGPQGSFECIKQTNNKKIESYGSVCYKLQVQASDDSYQNTKLKMDRIEQDIKKNCTKVIKASGPNVGRKVKVKRPLNNSTQKSVPGFQRNYPSVSKMNGSCASNVRNNMTRSSPSNNSCHNTIPSDNNSNRKPLRERVCQLLSVRPFTKPELIVKLSKELQGTTPLDKNELSTILNEVAVIKDDAYHLASHALQESQADFFAKSVDKVDDKEPLKDSLTHSLQNGISPFEDCSSLNAFSPQSIQEFNSPSASPSCNGSSVTNKRNIESYSTVTKKPKHVDTCCTRSKSPSSKLETNGYNDLLNGWANKPTSLGVAKSSNTTNELRPVELAANRNQRSPDSLQQLNRVNYLPADDFSRKTNTSNQLKPYRYAKTNGHQVVGSATNGPGSINSTPNSSPDSGTGSNDGSFKSFYSVSSDSSDYLSKYVEIKSEDQRTNYKADFYREYEEYRRLHRYIEDVASRFSELEVRLNTKIEGSEEWNILMDQIVKDYEETKNNSKFQEARRRMLYLHDKLAHIKKLVVDFDRTHPKRISRIIQKPVLS